ncbi:aminotransferase class I/II-fold pyridoxal phosphate-dependent enzyme [Orrella sp. 11846]|uniref:aminotransferase class I/II-fold pyridoxal phosphate-dependent enzyme n=1 Tax=Orrella sp. 11846 TaxID=3409913 RepID=UPI003B59860B
MKKTTLAQSARNKLISHILSKKSTSTADKPSIASRAATNVAPRTSVSDIPEAYVRFDQHPAYEQMLVSKAVSTRLGLQNPFFKMHDGSASASTLIDGREYLNFASYNYLGMAGHPKINQAAKDAIDRYGTTVSASRLVAGERPIQRELENALADVYGVDDCVVFVSGHATNVSTIGHLFGPRDLVVHDSLIHNSVLMGIQLSGAARRSFAHNDMQDLERILSEVRTQFERVLIVVEGVYSMDGDIADLPTLIELKRRYKAFLMVDEAHSLGILGQKGFGLHEYYDVDGREVDIWMGTLSKTLASCGGYICGDRALVEHLKYAAPGFVYSVGIAPPLAAASIEALALMKAEPERVTRLQHNCASFLSMLKNQGLATGYAQGHALVPVMTGGSIQAVSLSNALYEEGIHVQPIIYPGVEEKAARLRFFLSAEHDEAQLEHTVQVLTQTMKRIGK